MGPCSQPARDAVPCVGITARLARVGWCFLRVPSTQLQVVRMRPGRQRQGNIAPRRQAAWWRGGCERSVSGPEHRSTEASSAVASGGHRSQAAVCNKNPRRGRRPGPWRPTLASHTFVRSPRRRSAPVPTPRCRARRLAARYLSAARVHLSPIPTRGPQPTRRKSPSRDSLPCGRRIESSRKNWSFRGVLKWPAIERPPRDPCRSMRRVDHESIQES